MRLKNFFGDQIANVVSGAVDPGLIPNWVEPVFLKLLSTISLLDAQLYGGNVKNKSASLLVPLIKALRGIPFLQ